MDMLNSEQIKKLVRDVLDSRPDDIDCEECLSQVDRFVEMKLAGQDASASLPLVQYHLDHCRACREEFEALLTVLTELR